LIQPQPARKQSARPSGGLRRALVASVPNLRAFAISLCGDVHRADDLVQETLIKAWSHHASFEEGTNLKAWLFTILRNTYISELRKLGREVRDHDGDLSARLAHHPEQHGHLDFLDFTRALTELSPEQREALMLVGAESFSYEEAAEITGCEVGTVKSRVHRARVRLAQLLNITGGQEFGPDVAVEAVLNRASPMHRRP
jgi:RNA polymerase sigma-70 factor (ECF subfamily)